MSAPRPSLSWLQIALLLLIGGLVLASFTVPDLLLAEPLQRADSLEATLRGRLAAKAPAPTPSITSPEDFERLLALPPSRRPLDALPLYDEAERASFARAHWRSADTEGTEPRLAPPLVGSTFYEAGGVNLNWEHELETRLLAEELPRRHLLGVRVYRSEGAGPPQLMATLPLEQTRYRDTSMPLLETELRYELWSVLLAGVEGALVSAAPADPVTLPVPDHFTMRLLDGDEERARVLLGLGRQDPPVATETVELAVGEELLVTGRPTGLRLISLEIRSEERMQQRERLLFASDGSLVLDPLSGAPRRTGAAVLVPVEHLVATLRHLTGSQRTLETDLQ